jgi:telomerase reverse transcriptase
MTEFPTGFPIARLKPLADVQGPAAIMKPTVDASSQVGGGDRTPGHINFVRSRLLYARAALNAKGRVRFGLPHVRRLAHIGQRLSVAS